MQDIVLDPGSKFTVENTDFTGGKREGHISYYNFIKKNMKILLDLKDDPQFETHIYEYSAILKLLVKREILVKVHEAADAIDRKNW